jgi:hypothetical protein
LQDLLRENAQLARQAAARSPARLILGIVVQRIGVRSRRSRSGVAPIA